MEPRSFLEEDPHQRPLRQGALDVADRVERRKRDIRRLAPQGHFRQQAFLRGARLGPLGECLALGAERGVVVRCNRLLEQCPALRPHRAR